MLSPLYPTFCVCVCENDDLSLFDQTPVKYLYKLKTVVKFQFQLEFYHYILI